jgi:hypothetical protein
MEAVHQVDDVCGVVVDRVGGWIVILTIDASNVRRNDMPALAGKRELSFPHPAAQWEGVEQDECSALAVSVDWSWQSFEESESADRRHSISVFQK